MKKRNPLGKTLCEMRELDAFLRTFNKESDRGAALVAASRFDEVLKGLLRSYLRDSKSADELLDGFNAPLASFAARASAAHSGVMPTDSARFTYSGSWAGSSSRF